MRTMSFCILPFIIYNVFKETSDHHTEREDPSMSKRTESVFRRILVLFLGMFMILTLFGCQKEEDVTEDVSEDYGGDNKTVEDTGPYIDDYPRTKLNFFYNDLYAGTIYPKGKTRLLIIPVEIDGGDPMNEAFFERLKKMLGGPLDSSFFLNTKEYYRNASYGQFDLEYDIMPVYRLNLTMDEWVNREQTFKYLTYEREAIVYAIDHYVSDPSVYDSDKDGYLEGIVCITNEPFSVENASSCVILTQDYVDMYPDYAKVRFFVDTMVRCFDTSSEDYRNNVLAHELAHYFGIDDYYDYRGISEFLTKFDLQSGTFGDWNPFSKMAVGWIDPYVITPDVEKVTIKLRNSAEYPDAVLIPCGEWNGTPFDEYLLLDVFAGKGNNEAPFSFFYQHDYENDVCTAYGNTTVTRETMDDAPDLNPDYRLLALIPASRDEVEPGYTFYSSYLFHTGDVFTPEKYSAFFPNYPLSNKYGDISYRFTVDSFDNESKEAIITIEKIH